VITTRHPEFLAKWLCDRIGLVPSSNLKCLGSVTSDDTILKGVVGFDGYNGASVMLHMAGEHPHWLDRDVLFATFYFAFNELGCNQALAMVPSGNERALNINKRLGFEVVCELPGAHPDGSLFVLRMLRDNCRWLAPRRKH
jgi:hypothetical protein